MALDKELFGFEIEGGLLLNLLKSKGDVSSSKYLQVTFEGIRIPETTPGSHTKAIPFLIAQRPFEIEDMVLRFKWKGKKMRAGIFSGRLFDSQSRVELPFYGDINDRRIVYAIEEEEISREDLIRFVKNPETDSRPVYEFEKKENNLYEGNYKIPAELNFLGERGLLRLKRLI